MAEAMLAKSGGNSIKSMDSIGGPATHVRTKSFGDRDGSVKDLIATGASGGHPSDLFDMFKLPHLAHTDDVLFPTDVRPLGSLTCKRSNAALGIMSSVCLSRGKRPYMEDLACNVPIVADELEGFEDRPQSCFFGVFDGHGGYVCVRVCVCMGVRVCACVHVRVCACALWNMFSRPHVHLLPPSSL